MAKIVFLFLFAWLGIFAISTPADAVLINHIQTTLDEEVLGLIGDLPVIGTTTFEFNITNATGATWTDYHIDPTLGGIVEGSYTGPGTPTYVPPSSTVLGTTAFAALDIFNLSVAPSEVLSFDFGLFCAGEICSTGFGFPISGRATTDGGVQPVPEPSTLLLLASGVAGLAGFSAARRGTRRYDRRRPS